MTLRMRPWCLLALAMLSCATALAQANGPEFAVNTYTTGDQKWAAVAADGSGNFVVAWSGSGPGDDAGVFARRFSSAGLPLGPEFRVNTYTTGNQGYPSVASNRAGDFVVTWTGSVGANNQGVFVQRYDAAGDAVGGEFQVNVYTTCCETYGRIAMDDAGDFVVVWDSFLGEDGSLSGVIGRRYDASTGLGPLFIVNAYTTGNEFRPAVAMAPDGRSVVTWGRSDVFPADPEDVYGRRFDAAGAPVGGDFRVNQATTGYQRNSSVGIADDGAFVVVWQDLLLDGSGWGMFGRRFASGGTPVGSQFQANTFIDDDQEFGRIAVDPAGAFVVAWSNYGYVFPSGADNVGARRYDATGSPLGPEFRVNTFTAGFERNPAVAAGPGGQFVVAWASSLQDGGGEGVFGQRYGDLLFADSFESGGIAAWSTASTDGGDLSVSPAAKLGAFGSVGLQAVVNDTNGLFVEDDTPTAETRYRARFYFDTQGFDPGVSQGHLRTRLFIGFEANPNRRLFALVLRRLAGGQYGLMGRVRRNDDSQDDTGFFPITDGPHWIEIDWRRASAPAAADGTFQMWIDGASVSTLGGIDNDAGAVDFARLGALSLKTGAAGTLFFDTFESRRLTSIGPIS